MWESLSLYVLSSNPLKRREQTIDLTNEYCFMLSLRTEVHKRVQIKTSYIFLYNNEDGHKNKKKNINLSDNYFEFMEKYCRTKQILSPLRQHELQTLGGNLGPFCLLCFMTCIC